MLSAEERFWTKVDKTETCWNWMAGRFPGGYGQFWFNGTNMGAHRFSYTHLVGPIPDDLQLDHLCRNKICVNPEHLEAVTCKVNLARRPNVPNRLAEANAAKTHCPQGHEYTEENTRRYQERRHCRTCGRIANKHYQQRKARRAKQGE